MRKLFIAAAGAAVFIMPATAYAAAGLSDTSSRQLTEALSISGDIWQDPADNDHAGFGTQTATVPDDAATTTAVAPERQVPTDAARPGDIIDLTDWYLTLPTGPAGSPDTIKQPSLAGYTSQYMRLNDSRDGVVFTANAGGSTTKNSKYPRSELREMNGSAMASWDGTKGTHTMEIRQAVTKLPPQKAEVVVGQIHGTSDDLMQIHLSGKALTVKYDDGAKKVALDDNYELGRIFTVRIESAGGAVKVWYDGVLKADLPISSDTSYFKAGNYLQTNTSQGDAASATAEVVIYDLRVTHR